MQKQCSEEGLELVITASRIKCCHGAMSLDMVCPRPESAMPSEGGRRDVEVPLMPCALKACIDSGYGGKGSRACLQSSCSFEDTRRRAASWPHAGRRQSSPTPSMLCRPRSTQPQVLEVGFDAFSSILPHLEHELVLVLFRTGASNTGY